MLFQRLTFKLDKIHYRVRNNDPGREVSNELVSINSERTLTPERYAQLAMLHPSLNGSPISPIKKHGALIKATLPSSCSSQG